MRWWWIWWRHSLIILGWSFYPSEKFSINLITQLQNMLKWIILIRLHNWTFCTNWCCLKLNIFNMRLWDWAYDLVSNFYWDPHTTQVLNRFIFMTKQFHSVKIKDFTRKKWMTLFLNLRILISCIIQKFLDKLINWHIGSSLETHDWITKTIIHCFHHNCVQLKIDRTVLMCKYRTIFV